MLPPYPTLVAAPLEATYGAKISLRNLAVGGRPSRQGLDDLDNFLKSKPDLFIITYGRNDVGGRDPKAFRANIEAMLRRIREADAKTEVILVATMTGDPARDAPRMLVDPAPVPSATNSGPIIMAAGSRSGDRPIDRVDSSGREG